MSSEFWFDEQAAYRAEAFFDEVLINVKGEWAGDPFILEPWQRKIIRDVFGWMRLDGSRRYRTIYIEIPRKNGKSSLAAGVALYLLFADREPGAEVYSAAADKEQAAIVFDLASEMVEGAPALDSQAEIYKRSIVVSDLSASYKVLSADAYTKHGLNASGVVIDELHAQPNRDLVDVLVTSTGARRQPMILLLTTAGVEPESICGEFHDYAISVIEGVIEDPSFYGVIYSADRRPIGASVPAAGELRPAAGKQDPEAEDPEAEDPEAGIDWLDESVWFRANPNLGISVKLEYLRGEARKAANVPAYQNTFKRLHLNIWTEQVTRWLSLELWAGCRKQIEPGRFHGAACYGGLDLSSTQDLASLVLVFPSERDEPERFAVLPYFWIPAENAAERARNDRVPYDAWIRDGLIKTTEGNAIDYEFIIRDIEALTLEFDIKQIAFDRWGAFQVSSRLEGMGLEVVGFGQGFKDMSPPTRELIRLIKNKTLDQPDHAILNWNAANMVVSTDAAGNVKPNKEKSRQRIDGMVALIMGLARAIVYREAGRSGRSVYEDRGMVVI